MLTARQKNILEHAGYTAGATAVAGAISFVAAHGADLVGKKYEVIIAAVLIPALTAGRKWFVTRSKSAGDAPASK